MSRVSFRFAKPGALALFLLLFSISAFGQFRAGIQGTVTDSTGAVVPGSRVVLRSKETGQTLETTASDEGFYRFSSLAPGQYSISVESSAFKKAVVENVKVDAESITGLNVTLEPGGLTETVTVVADANEATLETEDASIRKTIGTEEVLRLPQAGRDPYELARLAPGVFGAGARGANGNSLSLPNTSGPGGSNNSIFSVENAQPISANGQRASANNFQVDGTSVNSQTWGGAAVITPSQESVKEVQVTSSTYSAEDGRNSGAQVKVVTQNGTNELRGSAFLKVNDPSLNAFNKFNGVPGVVTAVPTRVNRKFNSYGGSFGGPLPFLRFGDGDEPLFRSGKDRLFFFFSYEGIREESNNFYNSLVDTAQYRQAIASSRPGTVSASLVSGAQAVPRIIQTLPVTCATSGIFDFANTCRDVTGGLDLGSIGGTYGVYLDPATIGGGFDGIADLQFAQLSNLSSFRAEQYFTRIDFQATDKDKFAVSTFIVPSKAFTTDNDSQSRPAGDLNSERLNYAVGLIYTRSLSSTMLNEARFNLTRWGFDESATNPEANFGLPRIEIEAIFGGRLRYGARRGQNTPGLINERQLDFRDTFTNVIGNHVLKIGGEYRIDQNSNAEIGFARPLYVFGRQWNFANGTPVFQEIATDLTGKPARNNAEFQTSELAFFAQDDWKFRPNLTLNLGLRWSYYSPIKVTNGVIGNLELDSNGGLAGAVINTDDQLYDGDKNNFGPQVGLAWSPGIFNDKMVIRTGFGMGYDRLPNALLGNARRNPPNGNNFGLCCAGPGNPFLGGQITYTESTDGSILGFPRNPLLGGGVNPANGLPLSGAIEIYGAPRELPAAYVYRYSLEGQYQLPFKLVGTLGYQGSAGRHFVRILPVHITGPSTNPAIFAAYFASPDVNTNYNAMIARLQGRLMRQFSFDMNYRYSKSIDTVSFEGPTGATNQSFPVDQREERGPSDFDVRHSLTASGLWDLPFFNNRGSWKGKLLGGWQVNGIVTYHTGFPWTPKLFGCLLGTTTNNFCDPRPVSYTGREPLANTNENFLQPGGIFPGNLIPGADCNVASGCSTYFNTVLPFNGNPFANRPGIGRNVFRGPKYFSLDMSFVKSFGLPNSGFLGENSKVDVRFNFFNILNTLNLTPFNSNTDPTRITRNDFGTATSALSGRVGEFQIRFSF